MNGDTGVRRVVEFGRALRLTRKDLATTARLSPEELRVHQGDRFRSVLRHAAAESPFYRELYRGIDPDNVELADLPTVTKAQLMERFDDWVTDPRLNLADVERHVEGLADDALHLGEYRVMATSGSTGRVGFIVYSRPEWRVCMASFVRAIEQFAGIRPHFPRRRRLAGPGAISPVHVSARLVMTVNVGVHRGLHLDARQPVAHMAAALDHYQPEVLIGYPSVLALLADEQRNGRLHVRPAKVVTAGEVRTTVMEQAMREAWGVRPYDWYGSTEAGGALGIDCEHHRGMHLFEDLVIVENVDEDGRPVPDGVVGHKLLITNLFNRTQPLIRYEVSDMVAIDSAPCPCGRSLRRVVSIDGRSSDLLRFPGVAANEVTVNPFALELLDPFSQRPEVREYKLIQDGEGLQVLIVLREGANEADVSGRIRDALVGSLKDAGAVPPAITVRVVGALDREQGHGAKFKTVESRLGATAVGVPPGRDSQTRLK